MDLSPFQRHPRYVSIPPLRPHPPPFLDDPNFYATHHRRDHHLPPIHQPPPPLQPPPAPSYRPFPAPPPPPPLPYNPHQSQFTFRSPNNRPIEDDPRSHHLDFNLTPRVFYDNRPRHRIPEFDRPYVDSRSDVWDRARVPPENRPVRPYPVLDLDQESRHRRFDHNPVSSYRTIDKFRHDSDGSSRFRDDFSDGFSQNQKEEFVWGRSDGHDSRRGHFIPSPNKPGRNFAFGTSYVSNSNPSSRDFAKILGNYESRYSSEIDDELFRNDRVDGASENQRWGHSRQSPRDVPNSSVEMGVGEFGDVDGVRVALGKRVTHVSELGRFNNRGSRESKQEYDHTPRKQLQKKSAFLRIQLGKPNYRNKSDEQLLPYGYFDDASSIPFRGKDPLVYLDRRVEEEEEREGSPVELDVSFKSNSLVAKAIVAPSSPVVGSDRNLTPRTKNIRRLTEPDMDNSSSQQTKHSEGPVKLDCSTHVADNPSSSGMDLKQSEEKVTVSGSGNVFDIPSTPCSNGTNVSLGRRTVERSPKGTVSYKGGTNVGFNGKSIPKVVKKKKKVVKKVMTPLSHLSSSQPAKKHNGPVKAGNSTHSPSGASRADKGLTHSKEKTTYAGMVSGHNVVLQPCPNELTMLPESNKLDRSLQAIVSEKGGTNDDFSRACLPEIMRKRNSSILPLGSSSPEETKNKEVPIDADRSIHSLHTISNSKNGLIELQDNTTFPDIGSVGDVSKQTFLNGISVSLKNGAVKEPPEDMFSGGNVNVGLSSREESKIHEGPVNTHSSGQGTNNASSSDYGLIKYQEKVTVSDIDKVDADSKQPCLNQVTISLENGMMEGSLKAISSVGSNVIVRLSSSWENMIREGPINADSSFHGTGTALSSDNGFTNSQEKITASNISIVDDIGKQPCPDGISLCLENGTIEGSPKAMVSVGGNITVGYGKECTPKIKRKRKVRTPQSKSLNSSITDFNVGPFNVVSSANGVDTTLSCSVKDSNCADEEVTVSGVGNLDVGSQLCADGVSILLGNTSMEESSVDKVFERDGANVSPNGTSHLYKKKRKVMAAHPGLSSPTVSEINEGPLIADSSTSGPEVPSYFNNGLIQTGEEFALSRIATMCSAGLQPCLEGTIVLCENSVAGGSFEAMGSVRSGFSDKGLKLEHRRIDSGSLVEESAIPNMLSPCPSGLGGEQAENATSVMATTDHQNDNVDIDSSRAEKNDVHAAEEQIMISNETAECRIPLELQSLDSDQRLCSTDMECDSYLLVNDDLPSVPNYLSLSANDDGVSTTNFNDELMEFVPDTLSNMGSPEMLSIVPGIHVLSSKLSLGQPSNKVVSGDEKRLEEKPGVKVGSDLFSRSSFSQNTKLNLNSDHATDSDHSFTGKAVPLLSQDTKNTTHSLNQSGVSNGRKSQPSYAVPRMFPGCSSFAFSNSKETASSTHVTKRRTWHRTGDPSASLQPGKKSFSNAVPPQRQPSRKIGKVQSTSYIRKGNSLVRKPAPVASFSQGSHGLSSSVYRLNPSGIDEMKITGSDSRVDVTDPLNFLRTGGLNAAFERPPTPPLPHITPLPNCTVISPGDCTSSPLAEPLLSGCSETSSDPTRFIEDKDVPKSSENEPKLSGTPENQTGPIKSLESQSIINDGNLVSSKMKRIIYVKRKSNQLVAASNSCNSTVHNADKTQALSPDRYYKRSKNQLIRTSLESHIKQQVAIPDDSSNSEGQRAPKVISSRSYSKRRSDKGMTSRPSKLSLVWTLRDTQSSKKVGNPLQRQKVFPLFPWKRATYWRSFMQNSATVPNSLSMIRKKFSRKLLLLRKRDTVYTRSIHGYSLRKSKVLSVDGSSLKWSKSIERRSMKANEEATQAVAAAEKKRREHNDADCVINGAKTRNHSIRKSVHSIKLRPGERIFRIGSVRYKMDSSKRTLQRISDNESSCPAALQEKDAKKSYVPRRLVIGNDEYIQIGNSNQLIRDPKKRVRILASEKVRWSLHTARLRLARKRKYCQFFTRFGKCNKNDGKCPYIHDPSKIAVCTKFLNDLCSNPNCKLTHKVIPERMQDCFYFLQGLCSNENCPYRHVNVNPNASICEGFLQGYCSDSNECRKKHSYVCPDFEATGICPQGSKCKLRHPKSRSKGKKRKRSREQKNVQGRYFGSTHIDVAEAGAVVYEKHSAQNNENIFFDGRFADYISLDVSDEEAGETIDPTSKQTTSCDGDSSDLQLDDLDRLIKPIRIMK